jgi:chromosome partitioning protein
MAYFDAAVEFAERGDYLPTESTAPIGVAPELRLEAERS